MLGPDLLDYPEGKESLFTLARAINDFMPKHMAHLTREGLARAGKEVTGSRIALLGWAFIANSDDARNTPSKIYRDLMEEEGAIVKVHDPFVNADWIEKDLEPALIGSDVIAIFTGHTKYQSLDPAMKSVKRPLPIVIDGRNVIDADRFIQAGWIYKGIGRGDKNSHQIMTNKSDLISREGIL